MRRAKETKAERPGRALTISAIERVSGVPRSTIHFYVRQGLLPKPAKTAAGRSLYSEDHVRLLERISELKKTGRSLEEIKDELAEHLERASEENADLAEEESRRTRRAIILAALELFMTKGYRQTHVQDIIRKAGVSPHVFYSHFPSKHRLLLESFSILVRFNVADRAGDLASRTDFGERLLCNLAGDLRIRKLGEDVLQFIRSEGVQKEGEIRKLVEEAFNTIVGPMIEDLTKMRPANAPEPAVPLELIVYSLLGAMDNTHMRASWDKKYSRLDLLRTHLWIYLAIVAAMSKEVDIDSRLARYEEMLRKIAEAEPGFPAQMLESTWEDLPAPATA